MNLSNILAKHERSDGCNYKFNDLKTIDKSMILGEIAAICLKSTNIALINTALTREDVINDVGFQESIFDIVILSKRNDAHLLLNSNTPETFKLLIETHLLTESRFYPESITTQHLEILDGANMLTVSRFLTITEKYTAQLKELSIPHGIILSLFNKLKESSCYDFRKGVENLSPYIIIFGKKNLPIEVISSPILKKTLDRMDSDGIVAKMLNSLVGKDLEYIKLVSKLGGQ